MVDDACIQSGMIVYVDAFQAAVSGGMTTFILRLRVFATLKAPVNGKYSKLVKEDQLAQRHVILRVTAQ